MNVRTVFLSGDIRDRLYYSPNTGYCQPFLAVLYFIQEFFYEENAVIVFDKLWVTMREKGVSQYALIREYGFSTGQLDRLRKNQNVSSLTLNRLCEILNCRLEDIAEFRP